MKERVEHTNTCDPLDGTSSVQTLHLVIVIADFDYYPEAATLARSGMR